MLSALNDELNLINNLLFIRMLHLHLLLLRPLLVQIIVTLKPTETDCQHGYCRTDDGGIGSVLSLLMKNHFSGLQRASILSCVSYCASAAQEIIELIHSNILDAELLPPWHKTNFRQSCALLPLTPDQRLWTFII
jgi:hypothetical protein